MKNIKWTFYLQPIQKGTLIVYRNLISGNTYEEKTFLDDMKAEKYAIKIIEFYLE